MIPHSAKPILSWHYTAGLMKHGRCSSSNSWSHQVKEISVSCEHWIGIWKVACNKNSKWNEIWWGSRPASSGCVSLPPTASYVFAACQFCSFRSGALRSVSTCVELFLSVKLQHALLLMLLLAWSWRAKEGMDSVPFGKRFVVPVKLTKDKCGFQVFEL